jgi:hypothetical protein
MTKECIVKDPSTCWSNVTTTAPFQHPRGVCTPEGPHVTYTVMIRQLGGQEAPRDQAQTRVRRLEHVRCRAATRGTGFRLHYYTCVAHPKREMTFFQPRLSTSSEKSLHVYQAIFLDKAGSASSERGQNRHRSVDDAHKLSSTRHAIAAIMRGSNGFAATYHLEADFPHLGNEAMLRRFNQGL